jgi:hypothetical protein
MTPDIELKPAQLEAAANAVRRELDNVEALTEYSERGACEICEAVVRVVLEAMAPTVSPVAHDGGVCDCETPGDWHRVANDFQRAMFEERARAEKAEDDLIVRHEQLQEALDQLELFFDPRERNDVNIDAGDILRKHRRGPRPGGPIVDMERGRPDDELEAALDGDNPEPPLRS